MTNDTKISSSQLLMNGIMLKTSLQENITVLTDDENEVYRIARIILLFMFTSNIVGNISVLCIMWSTGRKKRMRFFIMNLAITDLFVAIGGILPELIMSMTINFYAPDIICRVVKYMSNTATYASSFALVVLSFDRAEAVINPLRSTKKTCFGVMRPRDLAICGWIAAGVCGIPGMVLAHLVTNSKGPNCLLDFSHISPKAYLTSVAVTVFLLPAFFITLCHVLMVSRIWQAAAAHNRELAPSNEPPNNGKFSCIRSSPVVEVCKEDEILTRRRNNYHLSLHSNPTTFQNTTFVKITNSATSTGCIPRARIKTVKMTLVIVSVYIMCWCPYMIWNLLVTFRVLGTHTANFMKISPLIQHLVTLNSSANPVIFWIFSAHTILTERRKNRRSKVVQRHHIRWKCATGKNNRILRGEQNNNSNNLNEDMHSGSLLHLAKNQTHSIGDMK